MKFLLWLWRDIWSSLDSTYDLDYIYRVAVSLFALKCFSLWRSLVACIILTFLLNGYNFLLLLWIMLLFESWWGLVAYLQSRSLKLLWNHCKASMTFNLILERVLNVLLAVVRVQGQNSMLALVLLNEISIYKRSWRHLLIRLRYSDIKIVLLTVLTITV